MIAFTGHNQWRDTDIYFFHIGMHACGHCAGIDIFIMGLGIRLRFSNSKTL